MKFPRIRKTFKSVPDVRRLQELIAHWESVAAESELLGDTIQQNPLFAGNCYGISDGFKRAAADLQKLLELSDT